MSIIEFLRQNTEEEELPEWLQEFSPSFNREEFFDHRTLYYPGSRFDAHPIKVCSMAHAVHTFVYVDDGVSAEDIVHRLYRFHPHYNIEHLENLDEEQLVGPNGWMPPDGNLAEYDEIEGTFPYYLYVVLCRNPGFDRKRGPKKLAILFIGRDGFETFYNLFCRNDETRPPYLIVVDNKGIFRGDFDNEGQLHNDARYYNALPELLLVGEGSNAWDGYRSTGACEPPGDNGAMNDNLRCLYELDT